MSNQRNSIGRRPRAPVADGGRSKLPHSHGLSRRSRGELEFLRSAWAAAGGIARKRFLSDLVVLPACQAERREPAKLSDIDGSLFGDFLSRHVVASSGHRIQSSAFYARYRHVCLSLKEEPISHTRFSRLLKERGYKKLHSNLVWWIGVALVPENAS